MCLLPRNPRDHATCLNPPVLVPDPVVPLPLPDVVLNCLGRGSLNTIAVGLEVLPAAIDGLRARDGCVILEEAVPADMCRQIMSDMQPYVECARARSESRRRRNGNQRSVRADALPARTEASWDIVAHPALLAISEAVLGTHLDNIPL